MKHIKIYEKFLDDFEEVWEEEPSFNELDFKFAGQGGIFYLISKYIDEHEVTIYDNFKYKIVYKITNNLRVHLHRDSSVDKIINNEKTIKIYSLDEFVSYLFKNLPMDIQDKVLKSYNII